MIFLEGILEDFLPQLQDLNDGSLLGAGTWRLSIGNIALAQLLQLFLGASQSL